eukprot:TRINITY_DN1591_c0_g1_i1.p1 TRINITY_DN1591_c0_g1~~TRINITY_DN1591_c0_g1_i1.p1  ORF type:complete len:919 (+),score=202.04 TRINITY_DN1591_c0_g1_i1:26-2758(+)
MASFRQRTSSIVVALLLATAAFAQRSDLWEFNYDPVANPAATVTSGNARFTVLTDRLLRLEYSANGKFEDRGTLAVVNRNLTVPKFTTANQNGQLVITTSSVQLTYTEGQQFSQSSLKISSLQKPAAFEDWYPGKANPRNLLGTIKSLDELGPLTLNCTLNVNHTVHGETLHCAWGLISRDGWAVLRDDDTPVVDATGWPDKLDHASKDQDDWYFFGHGLDYKSALFEYSQIGGRIAMPPRFANGIMWTRWYDLTNSDSREIVETYESLALPLDVFIWDMDWHQKQSWGGYTWDKTLFPAPADTCDWMKNQKGLALAANIHDDDGIRTYEATHDAAAKALGLPTTTGNIPFDIANRTYATVLDDVTLGAVEAVGMDFWWIDWQQGGKEGGCQGGKHNPTILLNHLRGTDHMRRGEKKRGLVLARWGGMGNHRYQIGFSGDVINVSWEDLAYQPYFSFTSSNVLYGFWSHDLVGPPTDHELHVRWLQWGAFSGVFRSHDRGMSSGLCADSNSCAIVEVWKLPYKYFHAARAAMQAREALIPYIYTQTRIAFDSGLGLLRPMYYDYPTQDDAYLGDGAGNFAQYMFGADILAAPVVRQASSAANGNLASITFWLPPTTGGWVEWGTGVVRTGGQRLTKPYDLSEIPIFVRAGTVIPSRPPVSAGHSIGLAARQYDSLVFTVFPGANSGVGKVYEDDGATTAYIGGVYAWTTLSYTRPSASSISITIATAGAFPALPSTRTYQVRLANTGPLASVQVNGNSVAWTRWPAAGGIGSTASWHYSGHEVTAVIDVGSVSTSSTVKIDVTLAAAVDQSTLTGVRGKLHNAILAKQNLDETNQNSGATRPVGGRLATVTSTGDLLSLLAGTDVQQFAQTTSNFTNAFAAAVTEVQGLKSVVAPARWAYSNALLAAALV